MYVLQENNIACVLCASQSEFYFIGDKINADSFKDEILPLPKKNDRLKLAKDVELNNLGEKRKLR